jgi:hypothetical protein
VSAVATDEPAVERTWTRTPEQEQLVRDHVDMIKKLYGHLPPKLKELFLDETIWGTPELIAQFGVSEVRVRQWNMIGKENDEAGKSPHPVGIPAPDAHAGRSGPSLIRGVMSGRARFWGWQGGKLKWDSATGQLVRNHLVNNGGRPGGTRRPGTTA